MKDLIWVCSSLEDLKEFPEEVMDEVGYALHQVQNGVTPKNAKWMTGFDLAVMEIVCDFDRSTYRTVYTIKIGEKVYVLHCFQKKSKHGISTPKQEIALIKNRLKDAQLLHTSKET